MTFSFQDLINWPILIPGFLKNYPDSSSKNQIDYENPLQNLIFD